MIEHLFSLNFREALQTPAEGVSVELQSQSGELLPPPFLDFLVLQEIVSQLDQFEYLTIELPNPVSSPTMESNIRKTLQIAGKNGSDAQISVHTRLTLDDVSKAIKIGAKRLHVYASVQPRNFRSGFTVDDILQKLEVISKFSENTQVEFIRASLEHTTLTPTDQVVSFLNGIGAINERLKKPLIRGLGIPDTTGVATPDLYVKYLRLIAENMPNPPLTVFTHLHDDTGSGQQNLETIKEVASELGINITIESVPKSYPGERLGIKPFFETDLPISLQEGLPNIFECIKGDSWVKRNIPKQFVSTIHVAGVHTHSMSTYSNQNAINYPHPGLYSIMGAANFQFIQRSLWQVESEPSVLKDTALLGREIAAKFGNKPHKWAIKLARLALDKPAEIEQEVQQINNLDNFYNRIKIDYGF